MAKQMDFTKLKEIRVNECRDLQGEHANKKITRNKNGFIIQCYETKHKRNFIKSYFIGYEDFIFIQKRITFFESRKN